MFDRAACNPPAPTPELLAAVEKQHGRVLRPSDRCVAYGEDFDGMQRGDHGVVERGPFVPGIELLFGFPENQGWSAHYDVRFDDGAFTDVGAGLLVGEEAFMRAWHVFDPRGSITAGGPSISRERAAEIAAGRSDGSTFGRIGQQGDPRRNPEACPLCDADAIRHVWASTTTLEGKRCESCRRSWRLGTFKALQVRRAREGDHR
jgi:hypothetical protein